MGVLNITPDSFSDGGKLFKNGSADVSACLKLAESFVQQGATFIDIGGESTRPGAHPVTEQEELDRILPVVEALARNIDCVISIDTSNPLVMKEAAGKGAGLINDVRALSREGALTAARDTALPVCLMHMQGNPEHMQMAPSYTSVVEEVTQFLHQRVAACIKIGISADQIILDPGIGFGKTDAHNLALLRSLGSLGAQQCPILIGVSRKSMIGRLLNRDVQKRLAGSLAFAYAALVNGAKILRVHDVTETVDIIKVFNLMQH